MTGKMHAAVCGLVVGLLGWGIYGAGLAQDAPAGAEVVPTPAPEPAPPSAPAPAPAETPRQYRPDVKYTPLQAGRDAHQMAEEKRRGAVSRQLWLIDDIRWYNTWAADVHRYTPPYIYAHAPPRVPRRVHRELRRHAYGAVFTPWPPVPGDVYGYPYYPRIRQPIGHEKIWTGPNSYIYRPVYEEPPEAAEKAPTPAAPPAATPAAPETRPQPPPPAAPPAAPPGDGLRRPAPAPPPRPAPEIIPAPPVESGPREF